MDAAGQDQAGLEVREGARDFVLSQLDRANLRISELEGDLRRVRREREEMARNVSALEAAFAETTAPEPGFLRSEAGRIASIISRLSVMQRRDMWLTHLSHVGVDGPLQWLYPHAGGGDPLTILVVGSGGFGDVLCLSPVVRELCRTFPGARVFVLHQHPGVELLSDLPYVEGVQHAGGDAVERIVAGASALDIFDLLVDVRYVVTYTAPPLSRVPARFLVAAHARSAEWQSYIVMNWPHLNNALAREAARLGMAQLDLTGYTANLNVSCESPLELAAQSPLRTASGASPSDVRTLIGRPYVTIHHGADRNMVGAGGLQTKNLPIARLERVVEILRAAGVAVAQLGDSEETLIPGDVVDLRGALAFRETAYVIAHACVHVDSEGGLVHAARSAFTPSVVAFGPTSVSFFGYPENVNIAPQQCGDCWWTANDWSRRCMRGLSTPECMDSHDARQIAECALEFVRRRRLLVATVGSPRVAPVSDAEVAAQLAMIGKRGVVVFSSLSEIHEFALAGAAAQISEIAVPAEIWREAQTQFGDEFVIHAIMGGRLPIATNSLDWLFLAGPRKWSPETLDLTISAGRCTKPDGVVRLRVRAEGADAKARSRNLVAELASLCAQRLGDAAGFDIGALESAASGLLSADGIFDLAFAPQEIERAPSPGSTIAVGAPA